MTKNALAVLMLLSCGGPLPEPEAPHAIMSGDYWLDFFPGETEGSCDFVGTTPILGSLTFSDAGVMKSPLEGVVKCETSYPGGFVAFTCKGLGNTLSAQARGESDKDGVVETCYGDGIVTGNWMGCKRVVFGFGIKRPQ